MKTNKIFHFFQKLTVSAFHGKAEVQSRGTKAVWGNGLKTYK